MTAPAPAPPLVVLDTNVFVAAGFRPRGRAAALVRGIESGRYRLVWDEPTRRETESVVRRIPPLSWSAFEPLFQREGRVDHDLDPESFSYVPDPPDRKFAALAAAAGALLVTSDARLLAASESGDFRALSPAEAAPQ